MYVFCMYYIYIYIYMTFANVVLDVQRFLEKVRQLRVTSFDGLLDHCELQSMLQQPSQHWLVSAQPLWIQMWMASLTQFINELRRHKNFVDDACEELVPMAASYTTCFNSICICVGGIVLTCFAKFDVVRTRLLIQSIFLECNGFVGAALRQRHAHTYDLRSFGKYFAPLHFGTTTVLHVRHNRFWVHVLDTCLCSFDQELKHLVFQLHQPHFPILA